MKAKRILIIGFAFSVSALTSCQVLKPETTYSKTDTTTTAYKEQKIQVKGATVGATLNLDSLYQAQLARLMSYKTDSTAAVLAGKPIPPAPTTEKKYFTDPQTKAQLSYWVDAFGKLQIGCESKDQTVNVLVAELTRLTKEVSKKVEVAFKTPVWCYIALSVLGTLLLISVLINVISFKRR